jgi:DNA-binding NarL/FixJ family response regulator
MSQWGVQMVIGKLITDEGFRRRFEERRGDCLANLCERGIDLDDSEIAALVEADPRLWSRMATRIDRRLRQVSASEGVDHHGHAPLTRREQHVLRGIFDGLTNKQIAADVGVSESAVMATHQQLFRKTRVRTRAQLVRIAIEGSLGTPHRHR